ncbi:MAG: GNAT family N-acetyltransferase [Pseudomonadota bacterium]
MVRIETDRLLLRDIDIEKDFAPFCEMMADEDTVRFIGGQTMTPVQTWRAIAMLIGHQAIHGYGFYSVIEKASGAWVGRVGHWNPYGWYAPEVGWTIHPAFTGKGFASEAGAACTRYAFETLGWDRVIHVIHSKNIASIKTAEKIGSRKIDEINGVPGLIDDLCFVYGQNRTGGNGAPE